MLFYGSFWGQQRPATAGGLNLIIEFLETKTCDRARDSVSPDLVFIYGRKCWGHRGSVLYVLGR